jgi:uncharacterized protein YutE (UPF0331/DUF86 family)
MTETILIKIERIEDYLKLIDSMKDNCLKEFVHDPLYRGALLYYLYLCVDSCISLAEMIIKLKGLRTPQSYSETIDILGEANIIPPEFAYEFAKMGSFRNFLAHDYEKIDYLTLCNDILNRTSDIKKFLDYIKHSVGK